MRIVALLDPATERQRYTADCDVSAAAGRPVTKDGVRVGTVARAFIEDGSLWAEMDIEDGTITPTVVPSFSVGWVARADA